MFIPSDHPYRVPFDGSFRIDDAPTAPPAQDAGEKHNKRALRKQVKALERLQRVLYADDRYALLLVFQAMDAAGKDSTIRAVTSGVNPAGFQVFSFKQPSDLELDHDFLWRTTKRTPERGRIGIFNRSYYEETLVVRVHEDILDHQRLPNRARGDAFWQQRFESIRGHEHHLSSCATVVLKFWLNVSKAEQKRRFLDRIKDRDKNWKFSEGDVREREHWDDYMSAYEAALNATSRAHAPWYAIPADDKPYMRLKVAEIVVDTLEQLEVAYPKLGAEQRRELARCRAELEAESE